MDRIQDSTRYRFQWPHESQDNDEGVPSGADHPSSSHTIDPDYLHHPQYDQAGTSFTPHPAHFPSTSGEYFPRNDDYHQFHPIARPRAIPYDPANQWQYELYAPAVSSHPDTRQFPFDEPSSSYAQNREEYGNPTDFHSQPPHYTSEHAQETPLEDSSNQPYASSFSSHPEQLHYPFSESHQPQYQPIVPPQARPFDAANQWQYGLYPPAIVPHHETQQSQPEPSEVSSHPETLQFPTIETSSLRIQKTPAQRLAPYLEESSSILKDDLTPFNVIVSSHNKMIMSQFRILPELENNSMTVDDLLRFISFNDNSDPLTRIQSFRKSLKKYELGSLKISYHNRLDHCRFERDPDSPNYAHLMRALEIISPLEQTYNLKRSYVSFCRSLHYFTHRPRVSRAMLAQDFDMQEHRIADLIVQFSRGAKAANIGIIKFKNLNEYTGKFFVPKGEYQAKYYHWKPVQRPQINLELKLG